MPEYLTPNVLIEKLKKYSGKYIEYALKARLRYISLRKKQDREIGELYTQMADRVSRQIRSSGNAENDQIRQLIFLEQLLREEADKIRVTLGTMIRGYIETGVDIGTEYAQSVVFSYITQTGMTKQHVQSYFTRLNTQAVEAIYARTYSDGLHLSDRIWDTAENTRTAMVALVREAVVMGTDARELAKSLQQYVKEGKSTLVKDHPELMKRVNNQIPGNISYEALRLARTEMTAAYGEGSILANRATPSYKGMKWQLSSSHPKYDVCDVLATQNLGLGAGIYPPGQEPNYPAHPNCLCVLLPVHEEPEDMVEKLIQWQREPESQPQIENWYNQYYRGIAV